MKKIIFLSVLLSVLSLPSLQANSLSKRLWRELDQAKHKTQSEKVKEQDLAWLEEARQQESTQNGDERESVDQVMAQFNRAQNPPSSEDSISLKMAAPQRKNQQRPHLAPKSPIKEIPSSSHSLTRQRNR